MGGRRLLLALLGAVLIAVGAVVGFVPASADGIDCGSAFLGGGGVARAQIAAIESRDPVAPDYAADCRQARSGHWTAAVLLLALGLGAGAGALAIGRRQERAADQPDSAV